MHKELGAKTVAMTLPVWIVCAYDEAGTMVAEGELFSTSHLNFFEIGDFVDSTRFGSLVFDFEGSRAGWVGARYSAFGRFSVEVESACRD